MTNHSRPVVRRWWLSGDHKGSSSSITVLLLVPAVILMVGLSVDGGRQLTAVQRAETAADSAARAGLNTAAGGQITGAGASRQAATARARAVLAQSGVAGTVSMQGQTMVVETTASEPTQYLSLIGLTSVTGRARATVVLEDSGDQP